MTQWKVELLRPGVGELPADQILEAAKGKLKNVLIIDEEYDETPYYAATTADGGWNTWMVTRFLHKLMNGDFKHPS